MAGNLFVSLRTPQTLDVLSRKRGPLVRQIEQLLKASKSGAVGGAIDPDDVEAVVSTGNTATASGALIISSGSGAVGGTINGVTVTDTWATSDTNSAGLVAAAINASSNALVKGFVRATNLRATATLASVPVAARLNICGTVFTAVGSATGVVGEFDQSGTDTADATALALAINTHPSLSRWVYAVSAAAVVHLFARQSVFSGTATFSWPTEYGAPANSLWLETGSSGITLSAATFAASAGVGLCANQRGILGNAVTLAASGTGVTVLNSNARLVSGLGGAATAILGAR